MEMQENSTVLYCTEEENEFLSGQFGVHGLEIHYSTVLSHARRLLTSTWVTVDSYWFFRRVRSVPSGSLVSCQLPLGFLLGW